jgi:hypothetical protein
VNRAGTGSKTSNFEHHSGLNTMFPADSSNAWKTAVSKLQYWSGGQHHKTFKLSLLSAHLRQEGIDVRHEVRPLFLDLLRQFLPVGVVRPVELPVPPQLPPNGRPPLPDPVLQPEGGDGDGMRAQLGKDLTHAGGAALRIGRRIKVRI